MGNSSVSWISATYDVAALIGVALCIYVMQKTEVDRISKVDPAWLRWLRRLWFIVLALVLCESILDESWRPSLPVLLLVMVGVGNLMINAVALHLRSPPDNTLMMPIRHHRSHRKWQSVRHFFARNIGK